MIYKSVFFLAIAISVFQLCNCNYEAVVAGKFPTKRAYLEVVYDGHDSVFILGGVDVENRTEINISSIWLYNITSSSLKEIGKFPIPTSFGTSIYDRHGNIFYLGGNIGYNLEDAVSTIWRFNATHPTPVVVGHLPFTNSHTSAVYDGYDHVYIFGGYTHETVSSTTNIVQFNTITNNASIVADLPMPLMGVSVATGSESAFVFGGYEGGFCHPNCYPPNVIRYSLSEKRASYTKANLPSSLSFATSVTVDEDIYVIGGYIKDGESNRKLRRFNIDSEQLDTFDVLNLPPTLDSSGVYIPKMNRIYLFAGTSSPLEYYSEILYIQL